MRLFASVIAITLAAAMLVAGTASGSRKAVDPKAGRINVQFRFIDADHDSRNARFAGKMDVATGSFASRPFGLAKGSSVELVPSGIAEMHLAVLATTKKL